MYNRWSDRSQAHVDSIQAWNRSPILGMFQPFRILLNLDMVRHWKRVAFVFWIFLRNSYLKLSTILSQNSCFLSVVGNDLFAGRMRVASNLSVTTRETAAWDPTVTRGDDCFNTELLQSRWYDEGGMGVVWGWSETSPGVSHAPGDWLHRLSYPPPGIFHPFLFPGPPLKTTGNK